MPFLDWLANRLQPRLDIVTPLDLSADSREKLCKALRVDNIPSVQDLLNSLLLSEGVYKAHDLGPQDAVKYVRAAQETFPRGLTTIQAVQCSLPHVHHRYLVASSPETVYVAFIGTKLAKDLLVDVNVLHRPLWQASEPDTGHPAAHRGFIARARRVPVEQLLAHAKKKKKKLLLCGHSLGGAVAVLCTLRVLQQASDAGLSRPPIRCITFGTPAIGNSALAARVQQQGWKDCFQNVILPEDLVPRLLALNPDASTVELSLEASEVPAVASSSNAGIRKWPNPGFASRLTPFRRPQTATRSTADAAQSVYTPETSSPLPPGRVRAAADETSAGHRNAAGPEERTAGSRPWSLPRMWRPTSESALAQEAEMQPRRASEIAVTASALQDEAGPKMGPVSRVTGAVQAVGQRLPLQGWWRPTQQEQLESGLTTPTVPDEDGAVEALVQGPAADVVESQTSEKSAATRTSWLSRLAQLQNLAVSAASSVGGVGQLLPTYVHFGQTVIWTSVENAPKLPVAFPTNDMRSRVLANHRMPAYRVRALAHCAAAAGLPAQHHGASSAYLSQSVVPHISLHKATAELRPLPPADFSGGPPSRWSWLPYVGNDSNSQMPEELTVQLTVEGEALEGLRQGRLLAYGSTWCPVRMLPETDSRNSRVSEQQANRALLTMPSLQWLQSRLPKQGKAESLLVEARVPGAVAAQVYHGHTSGPDPALELHLRSDFAELTVPVHVRTPTVWLLGSSTAATRRLILALSAQAPTAKANVLLAVQPAELTLDGAKWCNLLAAPVTSPSLALSALNAALPPNRFEAPGLAGPLRLSAGFLQGLQAWLVGPQSSLREGASCSAIVMAVDNSTVLPPPQLSKLILRAQKAGVGCIWVPLGGEAANVRSLGAAQRGVVVVDVEDGSGMPTPEALLRLRQAAYESLSGPGPLLSKL